MSKDHSPVDAELASLERKVRLLLTAYGQAQAQATKLAQENDELKAKLADRNTQVEDFQNQLKIIKLAEVSTSEKTEVEEVKQQLTDYIQQIDKAIALLSD